MELLIMEYYMIFLVTFFFYLMANYKSIIGIVNGSKNFLNCFIWVV